MKQICKFDKNRDIQKTRPGLSTNIELAIENRVVLDTGVDAVYNDIEEPGNIWCRVQDVFTALDIQKKVLGPSSQTPNNVVPSQPVQGESE